MKIIRRKNFFKRENKKCKNLQLKEQNLHKNLQLTEQNLHFLTDKIKIIVFIYNIKFCIFVCFFKGYRWFGIFFAGLNFKG